MPKFNLYPVLNNFTGGLVSPAVQARADLVPIDHGCKRAENCIFLPQGGVARRGGFMKVGEAATSTPTDNVRLIPFVYAENPAQSYILEFSPLKMRVYWGGDRVPVLDSSVSTNSIDFYGVGLNDLSSGASFAYTASLAYTYKIIIDALGTPDTFSWYKNNVLQASGVSCDTVESELENGVYIEFTATTGHTVGDYWTISFPSDRYELTTVFDNTDVPNIRPQKGDGNQMYLVDGEHEPQYLERISHNEWAINTLSISGEPFSTKNNSRYSFYRYHNAYLGKHAAGHVIDGQHSLEAFFNINSGESGGPQFLTTGKYTNNDAEGISTERGISFMYMDYGDDYPDGPDALVTALTSSFTGDYQYNIFLKIEGTIKIPYAGDWYFALNASRYADFAFNNDDNFLLQLYGYRHLLVTPGLRVQYENFTDEKGTNQKRISSKQVGLGAQEYAYWGRMMAHNTAGWGYDLAWRLGGDIVLGTEPETPSGKLSLYQLREYNTYVKHVSYDNENWYGNRCLEVQIFMDSDTTWGWKYKEITSFDSSGPVYSGEYVTINTGYGIFTNYQLNDPIGGASGPFEGDGQIADIDWDNSDPAVMGLANGMTWTFRVGFLPIPGSAFINTDLTEAETYPKVVTISDNRLWFFNSSGRPNAIWASKTGQFTNFVEETATLADDDALSFTLSSNQVDPIRWAVPGRKMLIGTASMEYVVEWPEGYPSPLKVPEVRPNTYFGSKFVQPAQTGSMIVFAEKSGLRLRSYGYRFDIDGYDGSDSSVLAYEEIYSGVKELAYQQAGDIGYISSQDGIYSAFAGLILPITNALWSVTDDGELKGITLEPEHKVLAWHEHSDSAETPGVFESAACIPGATGDELWVAVLRGTTRYIEVLDKTAPMDGWDQNLRVADQPADSSYFDCIVETLPFEILEGKNSTAGHKKRWVYVDANILAAQDLQIARGQASFDDSKQTFGTVTGGPSVARKTLLGWDKVSTLIVKAPGTDGIAYPSILLAIQGRIQINE